MKIKTAVFGASGYTGQELIRILSHHPEAELTAITSRRYAGVPVAKVFPSLAGFTSLAYVDASPQEIARSCDIVFLALPHGVSMEIAPAFMEAGKKVVDLSADYRLRDLALYEKWYTTHTSADLIGRAVYGLPELYRRQIREAALVANPGCYPTSVILGLAPLLKSNLIETGSIIANSASGVSGAGRDPVVGSLFCEVDGGYKAYKVGNHRHTPEIEQELCALAGEQFPVTFTPHLLPVKRGILSTIYATLKRDISTVELRDICASFYQTEKFVRLLPAGDIPNISSVCGSNYCDIGVVCDARTNRVIVLSAIDNLVKGAAGQAVQNMNIIFGLPEESGRAAVPVYP